MRTFICLVIAVLLPLLAAHAGEADRILGMWTVGSGDARVEVTSDANGELTGKIVWLRIPNYEAGDPEAGQPKHDRNNPDPARHADSLIGLAMLKGFHYASDGVWKGGTIYDPKNGKTYSCKITQVDDDHLDVRGFIGISLIGRTDAWTRYVESPSAGQ